MLITVGYSLICLAEATHVQFFFTTQFIVPF